MKLSARLKKVFLVVIGCIVLCATTCCALLLRISAPQPAPEYGKEFNPERQKRGLPIIPENWKSYIYSDEVIWEDPNNYWKPDNRWGDESNPEPPIYYQKHVISRGGNKIEEIDAYLGSNVYEVKGDSATPERVIVTCIYYLDTVENITCTADVYTLDLTYTNGDLEKAKAILIQWGLKYP